MDVCSKIHQITAFILESHLLSSANSSYKLLRMLHYEATTLHFIHGWRIKSYCSPENAWKWRSLCKQNTSELEIEHNPSQIQNLGQSAWGLNKRRHPGRGRTNNEAIVWCEYEKHSQKVPMVCIFLHS